MCRYFPYWVTAASLAVLFILAMLYLIANRQLLPGIVIMGSFILFVLWMVGLVVISIELWGSGGVDGNCNLYVSDRSSTGANVNTLAYLQQSSICKRSPSISLCRFGTTGTDGLRTGQSWQAQWAFELIGCVLLLWMMVMAYQVYQDEV